MKPHTCVVILPLIALTSCVSIQRIPPDVQATIECITDAVSMSGREVSVYVDVFRPITDPMLNVFGPDVDIREANEWLILYAGDKDFDGRFGLWGHTDTELQRVIFSRCNVRQVLLIAGSLVPQIDRLS